MFNECLDIRWKTAHFCILNFSFKNDFVWEEISNIRHSVSSPDETPRSWSKILRCSSYFQLSSRCFIWWWNTASHVWYITSTTLVMHTLRKFHLPGAACHAPRNLVILALYWKYRIMESPFNLLKTCLCRKKCNTFAVWGNRCYFGNKSNQM